jgi:preprotein translocase SecE subunit
MLVCLTAQFFYTHVLATMPQDMKGIRLGISLGIVVVGSILAWWIMNKPGSVDFLIATDSEMKKVNWTTRAALIGSTKVVILFMFGIAIILFTLDLIFNTVFYAIRVLNIPWWKQIFGQ